MSANLVKSDTTADRPLFWWSVTRRHSSSFTSIDKSIVSQNWTTATTDSLFNICRTNFCVSLKQRRCTNKRKVNYWKKHAPKADRSPAGSIKKKCDQRNAGRKFGADGWITGVAGRPLSNYQFLKYKTDKKKMRCRRSAWSILKFSLLTWMN